MSTDDDSTGHDGLLSDESIAQLYVKQRARVRAWFAKLYPHEDKLDDMVQEVFLRLTKRGRSSERNAGDPVDLMFAIASRVLTGQIRHKMGKGAALEPLDALDPLDPVQQVPDSAMPLDEQLSREQSLRQRHAIVEALPEDQRNVALMQISGLKPAEIATQLQVRVSTIRRLLQLAYRRCQRKTRALGLTDADGD